MRGKRENQPPVFFAIFIEDRICPDHPLRPLKKMIDQELAKMSALFDSAYSSVGRPSVLPERLLMACFKLSLTSAALQNIRNFRRLLLTA